MGILHDSPRSFAAHINTSHNRPEAPLWAVMAVTVSPVSVNVEW